MNIKKDFPIFKNKTLIYFDNASTTQKPKKVINAIVDFYENYNANIHRGAYSIAEEATAKFEKSRLIISKFINSSSKEVIFTKGTTESINLIAYTIGNLLKPNDEIIISEMEHHSNILPWQMLVKSHKIKLKFIPVLNNGKLDIKSFKKLISKKTKLISVVHISNILGTINPINTIIKEAKKHKILTFIDAAQSITHQKIDVKKIDCDFLAFSGHKIMGPTGVGALYIKKGYLDKLEPFLRGGHMIKEVNKSLSTWNSSPWKFEAGTANIAQVIGLAASIDYINKIGINKIKKYENELLLYFVSKLSKIKNLKIYGHENDNFAPIISFNIKGCPPYDVAKLLNTFGICIRAGHHCGQLLMKSLKINYTNRVSLYIYNDKQEIDFFIEKLKKVIIVLTK